MRQSYEAVEQRHGKELAIALAIWNKIYREDKDALNRKAAKTLINAVYRGGVSKEWQSDPNNAVIEVSQMLSEGYKKVIRANTQLPWSKDNIVVIL